MDTTDLIITNHARNRFEERSIMLGQNPTGNPDKLIKGHLEKSIDDISLPARIRVSRLLNNKFKDAKYKSHNGWRFILISNKLITCERIKRFQN